MRNGRENKKRKWGRESKGRGDRDYRDQEMGNVTDRTENVMTEKREICNDRAEYLRKFHIDFLCRLE